MHAGHDNKGIKIKSDSIIQSHESTDYKVIMFATLNFLINLL